MRGGHHQLGVEHGALDLRLASVDIRLRRCCLAFTAGRFLEQRHVRRRPAPAALVRQRPVIAIVFLLAGGPIGAHAVAVLEARGSSLQQDVVVDCRSECQPRGQVTMVGIAETVGLLNVVICLAIQIAAPDL